MNQKRNFVLKIALIVMILINPISVFSTRYSPRGIPMFLEIDDEKWIVLMRYNLKDNENLTALELDYESTKAYFEENNIYFYAIQKQEKDLELIVNIIPDQKIFNFSNVDDDELREAAQKFATELNANYFDVYKNKYKYIRLNYYNEESKKNVEQMMTVINGDNYNFVFKKDGVFSNEDNKQIKKIIDNVRFIVVKQQPKKKQSNNQDNMFDKILVGAIVAAIFVFLSYISKLSQRKNKKE